MKTIASIKANFIFLSVLLAVNVGDFVWATYFCIDGIDTITGGRERVECTSQDLRFYESVGLCCTNDQSKIGNQTPKKTYPNQPATKIPEGCSLAALLTNTRYECINTQPNGYRDWEQGRSTEPICCDRNLQGAVRMTDVVVTTPQQGVAGTNAIGPRPGPFLPQQTAGPRRFPGGKTTTQCRDLNVPGRPSDCPQRVAFCNIPLWRETMAQQCPFTCKLCSGSGQQVQGRQQVAAAVGIQRSAPAAVLSIRLGGGRGCKDWIANAGHETCEQMVVAGYCLSHRTQMIIQCPVMCGFC